VKIQFSKDVGTKCTAHSVYFEKDKTMDYVLITHEVADYSTWKKVFDHAANLRKEAGERSYQVLHYEGEPNKIVHFSAWTSLASARDFFDSPHLVRLRAEAGVKAPEFIYLVPLESGIL